MAYRIGRVESLSDDELCREMTGAWKYFYNAYTTGMLSVLGAKSVSELQALLQIYDSECKKRGLIPTPYTTWIADNVVPEMDFS